MFHELLMALSGFPGTIFFNSSEGLKVSSCIPNLHPAEKNILERLCSIGTKYKYLLDFVKKYKYNTGSSEDKIKGLYLKSFCCGLETIFNVYQQDLQQIEEELLKNQFLPLTHFLKFEKHNPLFDVMCNIVDEIKENKIHGCKILELLYNHSTSGVPLIEVSVNKVLQCCHSVMYRQVFCWMMNGYIEDPFKECFIQLEEKSITSKSSSPGLNSTFDKTSAKYVLEPKLLPSYIPSSLASKILYVGEYVSILGAAENSDSYLLFLKKEKIFSKKFEKLVEKPLFSLLNFETTIEDIRRCAAEHLWNVIVNKSNVMNHFKILKDFYLLGKGELFLNYIREANHLLRMPITLSAETDASKLFHTVARKTYPDDELVTEKFHVAFQENRKNFDEIDKNSLSKTKLESGWSVITLYYDVPHPLHILITSNVIDRYNMVFRFLLSVRKVQIELHQCWALQMQNKKNCLDSTLIPYWRLRSHMSFLIDNFQYYVLVDVLESCFSNLLNKMETVKDFEEIQQYHDNFLSSIISQCFLELRAVHQSLSEILEICSSFCSLMTRINASQSQKEVAQFENLKLNFQRHSSLLFRILSGVRSHQVSPHLAQLLLRIDYNKYLSTSGGQLGGTK